ncbi:MAG: sugar kinase [Candidatus Thorarchaeota archaeon]
MCPDIISLGELLVEIMRDEIDVPHKRVGEIYKGPYPSGAPAIFIDSAARLGKKFQMTTGFIGVVGNDEFGKCIIEKLRKDEVDTSQIRIIDDMNTGIAFNQYNSDGSRKFIFAIGAAGETSVNDVKKPYFEDVKCVHITGSALSISSKSRDACYKAVAVAQESNPDVLISFDPNIRPEMLNIKEIIALCKPILEVTDILLPSGLEAETLAGIKGSKNSCQKLLRMGPKIIVLKQGKEGSIIFTKDKLDGVKIESFNVKEKDPTGAGDSFGGAFIVGYLNGWDLEKSVRFANATGALKVQTFGPMPETSYEDINDLINESNIKDIG